MCGSPSQLYVYLQLVRLVENSAVLGRLEVLSGDPAIGDGLEELGALIRRRNWYGYLVQHNSLNQAQGNTEHSI